MKKESKIFGLPIASGTREELFSLVRERLGRGGFVATVNPLMLMRARRDPAFYQVLRRADLLIPDGVGVRVALALRGVRTSVLPGVELARELVAKGRIRIALFGAKVGVAERARDTLLGDNPALSFPLVLDGYTVTEGCARSRILDACPDLLYVCLGVGRQESFIASLPVKERRILALGLGGTLDVLGGAIRRAPCLVRLLHLEWLYRILREPRRLCDLPSLFAFLPICILETVAFTRKKREKREKN